MAKIDQATRRGRLITVFIGGLLIFGSITLAGFYLSHQRKVQFETAQNGSQLTNLDESEEIAGADSEGAGEDNSAEDQAEGDGGSDTTESEASESTETTDSVAVTGPSSDDSDGSSDGSATGTAQLPHTGPSDMEGAPSEIPATGPELLWVVAIVGAVVVSYLGFEYRRSRLAFHRAALRRE